MTSSAQETEECRGLVPAPKELPGEWSVTCRGALWKRSAILAFFPFEKERENSKRRPEHELFWHQVVRVGVVEGPKNGKARAHLRRGLGEGFEGCIRVCHMSIEGSYQYKGTDV